MLNPIMDRCLADLGDARGDDLACFGCQRGQFGGRTFGVTESSTRLDGCGPRTLGHSRARAQEFLALAAGGPGGAQQRRKALEELISVERGRRSTAITFSVCLIAHSPKVAHPAEGDSGRAPREGKSLLPRRRAAPHPLHAKAPDGDGARSCR
jgi:hypothetical protein